MGRPVIAAIGGFCYGGACKPGDGLRFPLRLPGARMAIPAAKLSAVYGVRGTARLLALVGLSETKRVFYSAKPFDAAYVLKSGFADAIDDDPAACAVAWLTETASSAPLSIEGVKEILNLLTVPQGSLMPPKQMRRSCAL